MAKNHYVSQFVIKRFSDAINIFDIHSGKIDESKRPHKVFYHNDIYEDETEKLFAHIESRVANIIDQKILKHDTITLTRKELLLLKRYMLICSVRTQTPEGFAKFIRSFERNAMQYISIYNNLYTQKITLIQNHSKFLCLKSWEKHNVFLIGKHHERSTVLIGILRSSDF